MKKRSYSVVKIGRAGAVTRRRTERKRRFFLALKKRAISAMKKIDTRLAALADRAEDERLRNLVLGADDAWQTLNREVNEYLGSETPAEILSGLEGVIAEAFDAARIEIAACIERMKEATQA